jgi:hypothetical protein
MTCTSNNVIIRIWPAKLAITVTIDESFIEKTVTVNSKFTQETTVFLIIMEILYGDLLTDEKFLPLLFGAIFVN